MPLVFRPYVPGSTDPGDNIWITIARVDWVWTATALWRNGSWSVPPGTTPVPNDPISDDSFPVYPDTYIPLGNPNH